MHIFITMLFIRMVNELKIFYLSVKFLLNIINLYIQIYYTPIRMVYCSNSILVTLTLSHFNVKRYCTFKRYLIFSV